MPSDEKPHRSRGGAWRRGWRGWCLGLAAISTLGGVFWWLEAREDRLGPVLPPERQRQEALVFLRLSAKEMASRDEPNRSLWLCDIAKKQVDAGDVLSAVETAKIIENPYPKGEGWAAIAAAQFRVGDLPGSQRSLALAMETAHEAEEDPTTQGSVLCFVATAQADGGDIEEAIRTARMIADPLSRAQAWCVVATAQAKKGDMAGYHRSITEAAETARETKSEPDHQPAYKLWAWNAVAIAQTKAGEAVDADRSCVLAVEASSALSPDMRLVTLTSLGEAQSQAGNAAGRDRAFAAALAFAQTCPDEQERASMISTVGISQALAGDLAGAAKASTMLEGQQRDLVVERMALCQARHGEMPAALATAQTIDSLPIRVHALLDVSGERPDVGDAVGQREALILAEQTARGIEDVQEHEAALANVASAWAVAGYPEKAVHAMDGKWSDTYFMAWGNTAAAYAKAGDLTKARRIARRLRPKPELWWNRWWDRLSSTIARWRGGVAITSDEGPYSPDKWAKAVDGIATAQARTGDRQGAIDTLRELPGGWGIDPYYPVALDLLESAGKPKTP